MVAGSVLMADRRAQLAGQGSSGSSGTEAGPGRRLPVGQRAPLRGQLIARGSQHMRAFPLSPTGPGVREPWGCRALGGRCGTLGPREGEDFPKGKLPGAQSRSRPWCQHRAASLPHPGPTLGTEPEARLVALVAALFGTVCSRIQVSVCRPLQTHSHSLGTDHGLSFVFLHFFLSFLLSDDLPQRQGLKVAYYSAWRV